MTRAVHRLTAVLLLATGACAICTGANVWAALEHRWAVDRLEAVQQRDGDHAEKMRLVRQREVEQHAAILYQQHQALELAKKVTRTLEASP